MPFASQTEQTANPAPVQTRIFREVPDGTYRAYANKGRVDTTKCGKPRMSIGFRVADGEYKGEWAWDSCTLDSPKGFEVAERKIAAVCPDWVRPDVWDDPSVVRDELESVLNHLDETRTALKTIAVKTNERGFKSVYVN